MLAVFLKILSILGIILLILFLVILVIVLLVLFVPVVYRADGRKDPENMEVHARAGWLFGFLRVMAQYSSGIQLKVKLLWFTLFDIEDFLYDTNEEITSNANSVSDVSPESDVKPESGTKESTDRKQEFPQGTISENSEETKKENVSASGEEKSGLYAKYENIKCKIHDIRDKIRDIYGKVKDVLENVDYYKSILEEKDTKDLFQHVCIRIGRVLKALKPRKYKADILFGTGAPDTTGYAFGVYGILSPHLGNNILVTPDFTRAVLEGSFALSGRVSVFSILVQGIYIIMDKRLHLFMDKIKHK